MNIYTMIDKRHGGATLKDVVLGLASESGECAQLVRKEMEDIALKPGEMIMELSDVWHYLVLGCACFGITLEDLMMVNKAKMRALDVDMRHVFEHNLMRWDGSPDRLEDVVRAAEADVEMLKW